MGLSGTDFELLVKPFFKNLFEKIGYKISDIRNQKPGTQNGFDIKVEFEDLNNIKRGIFIECKYYSSKLEWKEIVIKQLQLWGTNYVPDGFIALSPKVNLSNINDNIQAKIDQNPIFGFPSDFWTPDKGIEEIFSIDKDLYQKVYGKALTVPVDESQVIQKAKGYIEDLLHKKDEILKNLPSKKRYSIPELYIPRKVISAEAELGDLGFLTIGENILEIFNKEPRIALLGWAGTGKSVELEYLASELSSSTSPYFTFLITLNNHVDKILADYIPNISRIPENNIALLLDGLDEVQAKDFEITRRRVNKFCQDFPTARVIVSCRSNFYSTVSTNGNLSTLSGFKSFSLSNLTLRDIENFLDANLPLKKTSFLEEVQSKGLSDLLHYPFYFRRLVEQYKQHGRISNSKADFFESVITDDVKADVAKYFSTDRDTKLIEGRKLLEKLAFILEYQGKNLCTWQELMLTFNTNELDTLKRLGRTLYGEEGNESVWKFNHNNTQEYLSAKFLTKLQFKDIKEVIAFPKSYTKVKPTWANTLSLLFSILPAIDQNRLKLTNWLVDKEPELFVKFEPDRIDSKIRYQVLKSILEFYEKQGTRINHSKYDVRELASFTKTDKTLDLLTAELDLSKPEYVRANALEIILHYNAGKTLLDNFSQLKIAVKKNLFDKKSSYLAMKAYIYSFKLDEQEYDEFFNLFKGSDDTYTRYALYSSIHHQNYQDKYVRFVVAQIEELMRNELNSDGRLSNEYTELKDCISKIKTLEALEYVVNFVSEHYWSISYSIYFNEIIDYVLEKAIKESPNERIYQRLKIVVLSEHFSSVDKKLENLKEYFKETGNFERVFQDVFNENKLKLDYHSFLVLALLANEKNIEFFANQFIDSKIDRKAAEGFQSYLNRDNPELLKVFNTLINKKELIPLPTSKQFESTESIVLRTKEIIFSKVKFKSAIEQVFLDSKKDELTYEDVWEIHREYEKYLPVIHDTILVRSRDQIVKKEKLLKYIEDEWESFSIKRIINLLKHYRPVEFTDSEIHFIKTWCDKEIVNIDFRKALSRSSPNSIQASKLAVKLSFLIRRLNLNHYSKEIYLDMLSFQRWDDNEISIADFVSGVVPQFDINKRVSENLSSGIDFEIVLESHIEYAQNNLLKECSNSLLKYLKNDGYGRYKILDCYIKLNGSISDLENILPEIKDDFRHKIFDELINHNSSKVLSFLISAFKIEKDEAEKLVLASKLIRLQNLEGLRYYVSYIKRNKRSIEDSSPSNPLYRLTTLRAIPWVLILFELSYDTTIKHESYNRLDHIALGALQSICRHNDNYPRCLIAIKFYRVYFGVRRFLGRKLSDSVLADLKYFIESQELEYYTKKSLNIGLLDAEQKFKDLVRKPSSSESLNA